VPVRHLRLLGPAIALLLLAVATVARADIKRFAEHLRELDPGGKVGGKSIVGTKPKEVLHGVHGKPNFIVALGDEETIHGASKNDQIGALGKDVKLVPSNHGHSLIVAGPHSKIAVPGRGHDLIVSHARGATIILKSPADEVIANGPHDRIVCKHHTHRELIEVAKRERVSKSCRGHHNAIERLAGSSLSAHSSAVGVHASVVASGSGTNTDPFVAACDDPSQDPCTVTSFASRTLGGFWANEFVPSYHCPGGSAGVGIWGHPFLLNQNYAPFGAVIAPGVEVEGLGDIGARIETTNADDSVRTQGYRVQTDTLRSTATNWTFSPATYRVILHCTINYAQAATTG
jgi:hypothetical protein